MSIEIRALTLGLVDTNCYLVADSETKEALVIDPVDDASIILEAAEKEGWTIKLILATHGHFDHILASKDLKAATQAPFYIHEADLVWLESLPEQGLRFFNKPFPEAATPDRLLTAERITLELGAIKLETLFTPGHAPGHISYYMPEQQIVFGGDALFKDSIGRTDLPYADTETLMHSIETQLLSLPDEVQVLPGHMDITTIGRERRMNPFIRTYLS